MREFGKISSSIWGSERFCALPSAEAKLFYLYVHTCQHGNSIGCFKLHPGYIMADLGWEAAAVDGAIKATSMLPARDSATDSPMESPQIGDGEAISVYGCGEDSDAKGPLLLYDHKQKLVYIDGFFKHTPITNKKHALGALNSAMNLPDSSLKALVIRSILAQSHTEDLPERKTAESHALRCKDSTRDSAIERAIERAFPTQTQTHTDTDTHIRRRPDVDASETQEDSQFEPDNTPELTPEQAEIAAAAEKVYTLPSGRSLVGASYEAFERFWDAFDLKQKKQAAGEVWADMELGASPELERIIAAAAKECVLRKQRPKTQTAVHPDRWLDECRWKDGIYDQGSGPKQRSPEEANALLWERRLTYFKEHRKWPQTGVDKSTCPPAILKEAMAINEEAAHA